jgi:hypothetical protein
MHYQQALQAVMEDHTATVDERDAAKAVRLTLLCGGTPARDLLGVLQGYVARQLQQDRYGK